MKRAFAVAALVVLAISCLVDRRSTDFECDTTADCADVGSDRECVDGYCVTASCPQICDDCDPGKICKISCNQPNECRQGVMCPSGYNCQFTCTQDCTPVNCTSAMSCTVTCSGASCGPLNCGAASPCMCSGTGCL